MQQNTKLELDEYKHFGELFIEADRLSNKNQKFYLSFRFTQMLLLTLSTLIAIYSHGFTPIIFIICVSFSLILHLIIRIYNFDKSWYRYRSLAESIKSASWQFIMRLIQKSSQPHKTPTPEPPQT
ncbi:DUF4231 domain-containing protein, partial [Rothia sp. ND6WE1A]|uniref:DUF4231 domain-containing protein n=1 Tax=Rothia sp. ND6WE1A TaxID=1848190 RepID=UPI001147A5E3